MRSLIIATVIVLSANPSLASEANGKRPASEIVKDIVDKARRAPDGTMQPSTGRAKPVENWFGCKPGSKDADICKTKRAKK